MSGTYTDTWEEFPFLLTDRRDNAAEYVPATGGEPSTGMPALWVWGGRTPFPIPIPFPFPTRRPDGPFLAVRQAPTSRPVSPESR